MGDMWEALEKQQAARIRSPAARAVSLTALAITAKQHFKQADFNNSGRIDDDECLEILDQVAMHSGLAVPPADVVKALIADCSTRGVLSVEEFVNLVKMVAEGPSTNTEVASPSLPESESAAQPRTPPTSAPPETPAVAGGSLRETPSVAGGALRETLSVCGTLRVQVLGADDLPTRANGTACEPYVTIAVNELLRRRTRRIGKPGRCSATSVSWADEWVEFERTSESALVVADVWDLPAGGRAQPAEHLGKAAFSLDACRPGVPHTYFAQLLEGSLVLTLLFRPDKPEA